MEPALPRGSLVIFRRSKGFKRSDVVLADHPELGRIVRKVSGVGRQGNVHLTGTKRDENGSLRIGKVPKDKVLGRKFLRLI